MDVLKPVIEDVSRPLSPISMCNKLHAKAERIFEFSAFSSDRVVVEKKSRK
jgi:hypothetical protein